MGPETVNKNKNCEFNGPYAGRDLHITLYQESERKFVVTRKANTKPVFYFAGREKELQDLRQRIEGGHKAVLVSGMGGIGKTHICRKLFEEYYNRHNKCEDGLLRHIGYIEYNGDMDSSLMECLMYKKQDNPELNKEAAWKELEDIASEGKFLLFVDNVDKSIREDSGLKRLVTIPGAIILTSRRTSFSDEFEPYLIGFLDQKQCVEIFMTIRFGHGGEDITAEEMRDLEYIIETLAGRHTITVELLAHLAKTKLWGMKKLREELEKKKLRLVFHKNGELVNIQEFYEKLYDLSGLTEAEKNIMEAFSVFPYISLEAEVCNEWLLADAGAGEESDILMGLYQKGWLQLDMDQKSYILHPVFAQFIFDGYMPKKEKHYGLIKACQKSLKIPKSGSALERRKYIPFAINISEKLIRENDTEQADFITDIAGLLDHLAEYQKAEKLYGKALSIRKQVLGEEHPDTAMSYNSLAVVYWRRGEYEKAEALFEKLLRIDERVLGEEHPNIATSYSNLAMVYESQGKYEKAEALFEKVLRIRERTLGEGHLDVAASYNNLARIYNNQGKCEKVEVLFEKALKIRERTLGEEHPFTATSYNNLAVVYRNQGKYEKAKVLFEKAIRIREQVLGEEHPDTAASYDGLAHLYDIQGKYESALRYYQKAYNIYSLKLGENHLYTRQVYKSMEYIYFKCEF